MVAKEHEIIAKNINIPIYCTGANADRISAPNAMFDAASRNIGYPTSVTTSSVIFFLFLDCSLNCAIK